MSSPVCLNQIPSKLASNLELIRREHIVPNRDIDIKALTSDGPDILPELEPAFKSYNEKQLATVKLPGSSQQVFTPPYILSAC